MSLQLNPGRQRNGQIHQTVSDDCRKDRYSFLMKKTLLIVPEQKTMQVTEEYCYASSAAWCDECRCTEFFERLAYRIFEELGLNSEGNSRRYLARV